MNEKYYPCDVENGFCPFDAEYSRNCEQYCGLGLDEETYDEDYE